MLRPGVLAARGAGAEGQALVLCPEERGHGTRRRTRRELGLERLEPIFAREMIDAETLPLLAVSDLTDVGVPAGDAERIVAAVAPESLSASPVAALALPPATARAAGARAPPAR